MPRDATVVREIFPQFEAQPHEVNNKVAWTGVPPSHDLIVH